MSDIEDQLHELELEFGLGAREILDIIGRRNRCKIAVRGAIAEAHLLKLLQGLQADGAISGFQDFDLDGYPDCRVEYGGKSFLLECKNVRSAPGGPITVDFQRTRNPIDRRWERYYLPNEFDILAACLWNRTHQWDFRFAATRDLPRHRTYPDRLETRVVVDLGEDPAPGAARIWTPSLPTLLRRVVLNPPPPRATDPE